MSQPHNLPELPTQAESETRMAPHVAAAAEPSARRRRQTEGTCWRRWGSRSA